MWYYEIFCSFINETVSLIIKPNPLKHGFSCKLSPTSQSLTVRIPIVSKYFLGSTPDSFKSFFELNVPADTTIYFLLVLFFFSFFFSWTQLHIKIKYFYQLVILWHIQIKLCANTVNFHVDKLFQKLLACHSMLYFIESLKILNCYWVHYSHQILFLSLPLTPRTITNFVLNGRQLIRKDPTP